MPREAMYEALLHREHEYSRCGQTTERLRPCLLVDMEGHRIPRLGERDHFLAIDNKARAREALPGSHVFVEECLLGGVQALHLAALTSCDHKESGGRRVHLSSSGNQRRDG